VFRGDHIHNYPALEHLRQADFNLPGTGFHVLSPPYPLAVTDL
jgi:hypothetical protein